MSQTYQKTRGHLTLRLLNSIYHPDILSQRLPLISTKRSSPTSPEVEAQPKPKKPRITKRWDREYVEYIQGLRKYSQGGQESEWIALLRRLSKSIHAVVRVAALGSLIQLENPSVEAITHGEQTLRAFERVRLEGNWEESWMPGALADAEMALKWLRDEWKQLKERRIKKQEEILREGDKQEEDHK